MKQSTILFGGVLLAFLFYITLRGHLPGYLAIFTGASVTGNTSQPANDVPKVLDKVPSNLQNTVKELFSNSGWI